MKKLWLLAFAASLPLSAHAAPLIADGISYTLTKTDTANPLVENFSLAISGINTATDTEGGRTGINAIAFTDPTTGNAVSGSLAGFVFVDGGLNSTGCNGTGNFYCLDNTSIPPTPNTLLGSTLTLNYSITLGSGSWDNYHPDFKIDWVGTQNNYDLVSLPIDVTTSTPPPGIPEPMTLSLLGIGLLGLGTIRHLKG